MAKESVWSQVGHTLKDMHRDLDTIASEVRRRFPGSLLESNSEYPKENNLMGSIRFRDLGLAEIMGDAYPAPFPSREELMDDGFFVPNKPQTNFAYFIITPRVTDVEISGYHVKEEFVFGGFGGYRGGEVTYVSPRENEVRDIAVRFAKLLGQEGDTPYNRDGRFSHTTVVRNVESVPTPEKVRELVMGDVIKYIEHGRANPFPKQLDLTLLSNT